MATTQYFFPDGTPVPRDMTVRQTDHFETTLVVKVRSLDVICGQDLKQKLQEKWEVLGTPQVTESKCFVRE